MRLNKSGVAIVIVLSFVLALLTLGGAYLKTFSHMKRINPKILQQVQSDYFGQGMTKIALLKFKKYPADFYHAYLRKVELDKGTVLPALTPSSPEPIDSFLGASGSVLQDQSGIISPVPLALDSYSTEYRLISHKAYNKDGIEILINLQVDGLARSYRTTIEASRTLIL